MYNSSYTIVCISILITICIARADANNLVPKFNLEYEYQTPGAAIKFRTIYDSYKLTSVECGGLNWNPVKNEMLTNELKSCKEYQCKVGLTNNELNKISVVENITTGIDAVPPLRLLDVVPGSHSISIKLTYLHIDCITSFYVLIDESRAILFTKHNLSSTLIISDLPPCVNYNVLVLLNYQYTQYVLFDNQIKSYAHTYSAIENIQYNFETGSLTWSPVIVLGCGDVRYRITVQSSSDGVNNEVFVAETKRNELQLEFLSKCQQYIVTIGPIGYHGLNGTLHIENKMLSSPGRIKSLTVDLLHDSMISIKWNPPIINPECVNEYLLKVNNETITTKALEHVVPNYNRSVIYNIAVCTITKPTLKNCVTSIVDSSNIDSLGLQNITSVDVTTNYAGKLTTLNWNWASDRKSGIKYYSVRVYDVVSGNEIYRSNTTSTVIHLNDLGQCHEYYFVIETVPVRNWTNKIHSRLTFKSKAQIPVAPQPPSLNLRTSSSLTMSTNYQQPNDKCEIELYRFACSTGSHVQFVDSTKRFATITNLRCGVAYVCYAMVKNEIGWSDYSAAMTFETDIAKEFQMVELYVKQVLSKSIVLAWATTLNSTFSLRITKVSTLDSAPNNCKSNGYDKTYQISSEFKRGYTFVNLEPNTNYSIQVATYDRFENYSSQVHVATHPDIAYRVNDLHITSLTSKEVSISWKIPCTLNGRINHFIVAVTSTDDSFTDNPVLYRRVPFSHQLQYTETNIMPNHSYSISVAVKLCGFAGPLNETTIRFVSPAELSDYGGTILYIIIIACFILVLVILIGLVYYRRYASSDDQSILDDTMYIDLPRYSSSIRPANDEIIRKEFQSICDMDLSHLSKTVPQNQVEKNRNLNIIPYDFNRVILKPNQHCFTDYVNASFIDGYNDEKTYIATQGPNQETVYDFWHMAIQEECDKIVMLTELVEYGCAECTQYYPNLNKTLEFGDIVIKNVDETKFGNFIKRSLCIRRGKMKRHFDHYHYMVWPICGVPQDPLCLIEFIEISGTQTNESTKPIVVHSLAGAGRTGTFIALDILFQNCRSANKVSILQTVKKLRSQRCGMIETFGQYEFLYASIKSYYLTRVYKRNEWL